MRTTYDDTRLAHRCYSNDDGTFYLWLRFGAEWWIEWVDGPERLFYGRVESFKREYGV